MLPEYSDLSFEAQDRIDRALMAFFEVRLTIQLLKESPKTISALVTLERAGLLFQDALDENFTAVPRLIS